MSDLGNLQTVRQALVAKRRELASRGAMSPADGGRAATQIKNIQSEIDAIDIAIADERVMEKISAGVAVAETPAAA